jgi:hypothetical protein
MNLSPMQCGDNDLEVRSFDIFAAQFTAEGLGT